MIAVQAMRTGNPVEIAAWCCVGSAGCVRNPYPGASIGCPP